MTEDVIAPVIISLDEEEEEEDDDNHTGENNGDITDVTARCPDCRRPEDPDDPQAEIWFGCDRCAEWWHAKCLEDADRRDAESSVDNSTKWLCPLCVTTRATSHAVTISHKHIVIKPLLML